MRLAQSYKHPLSALCREQDLESCLIWDVNLFLEQYNKIRMDTCPTFNLCAESGETPACFKTSASLIKARKVSERADGCVWGLCLNLGSGPNG